MAQFLKIPRGAGHVGDVVVIRDRSKEREELQVESAVRRDCIELVEQYDELAPIAPETFEQLADRIEPRLQPSQAVIAQFIGQLREQLFEKLRERECVASAEGL